MEIEYNLISVAVSTTVVILLTVGYWILNWLWLKPKMLENYLSRQGLRGNPYRLLIGDLKENARLSIEAKSTPIDDLSNDIAPRVAPFLHNHLQTYGKNFIMWIGPVPRVTIMNPDHIKEILNKNHDFPKINANPLVRLLIGGLANHEGDKWAKHRKIISPAFHQEKLKLMQPAFYESCNEIVSKWEDLAYANNGSCEIDVWPELVNLSGDVISRTAFGSNFQEGERIFQLQAAQTRLITQLFRSPYIPGSRFLPTKMNRKIKKGSNEIREILMGIIKKRLIATKSGEAAKDDLLGILLDSNDRESRERKNVGMSIDEVITECKLFYLVGQETTSILLVWTMVLLSKHKNWQEQAREEVMQIFGNNTPDYDGLNHLKVVTMILYEVLRLYTPVTGLRRKIDKEMKLGDLKLPAGVQLSLPTILVHRDRDLWGDDALKFKPERFADGVSKATKNQVSYFPFGWGPRNCIGQNFALVEAKMAVSMILQRFFIELSPSYVHAPYEAPGLHPQHGAPLILHKI
jgi:cytochrome P450